MSDSSSPPRKRRRMSSPTYDEQLALPSQEELSAMHKLELSLSQAPSHYNKSAIKLHAMGVSSQGSFGPRSPRRATDFSDRPIPPPIPSSFPRQHQFVGHDDPNDPFTSTSKSFTGFISASATRLHHTALGSLSSDPESGQCERDVSVEGLGESITPAIGFTSASDLVTSSVGFTSVSALVDQPVSITRHGSCSLSRSQAVEDNTHTTDDFDSLRSTDDSRPFSMFTSLGKKNLFQPSAAAMRTALERAERWAAEDDSLPLDPQGDPPEKVLDVTISARQALLTVENVSPRRTDTSPTAFRPASLPGHGSVGHNVVEPPGAGQVEDRGSFQSAAYFSTPTAPGNRSLQMPSVLGNKGNASMKSFKSPLLKSVATRNSDNPPSTPSLFNPITSTPTREHRPTVLGSSSFPAVAPMSGAKFSTPMPIRGTPMRKVPTKKFVTPFKQGMRPGEPGHTQLKARHDAEKVSTASGLSTDGVSSVSYEPRGPTRRRFFNLTIPLHRKTLASSGFWPGIHGSEAPADIGIDIAEPRNVSPKSAIQHRFYVTPQGGPSTSSISPGLRGPVDAFRELKAIGGNLATQEWVDNHWSLILWKLAGMATLDPKRELDVDRKRWSWTEMMRQLRYRYEKELNGGARPALRLITAQDTSAGLHMILCVSDITWSESAIGEDGLPVVPHPTLELTDGWYRLRARVDEVLARAARRGVIRVGRKIAASGASIPRDAEPCEVLEAYHKVELNLTGNGTHLAPWHAKLGFQRHHAIATLHTLSPEGGSVPCLELVVAKSYPIAFLEFHRDADGQVTREGPRREKEELAAHDAWTRKREREYQQLRKDAEDKHRLFLDWAQRFEAKSGSWHPGNDEDMPGHIESMFDECEYSSDASPVLRRASRAEAGWLARFTRERAEQERETSELGIERELQSACPLREVRSFRVLLMRDARTTRRPARRVVELTVWDVLSLTFDGAPAGHFKDGQRFQITNLLPTQKNAWMDRGLEDSHVYLSTSKISRWTKL
ncbi:hypothetical protein BJV78DRAFT_220331 [Lactifluus subvellereus]|nr:hypothetical protein BJV78DRAFT_220331 [Lactifluus subvellereus]